jgi:hypothetical protein
MSMEGDEVTDIDETIEATSVAKTLKEVYFDIVGHLDLPEHHGVFSLGETTASTPVTMTLPSDVMSIDWIKYNNDDGTTNPDWKEVKFLPFKTFVEFVTTPDLDSDTNTQSYVYTDANSGDTTTLKCRQDAMPRYYTTPDDSALLFDAFDEDEDTFLTAVKTMCYGQISQTWTHSNSFTPDLDHKQFSLLLNEAKAQCFVDLKQQVNTRAERKARNNWINTQKKKQNIGYPNDQMYFKNYPNYGRK